MSPRMAEAAEGAARRESVLQRKLTLADMLDAPSFAEVVKGFCELYQVGIKVFDEKGNRLADVKVGNGDFCGYVFSFPEGRARCTAMVARVKDGPLDESAGAAMPEPGDFAPPAGLRSLHCFTGLRYLAMPIVWEGERLGRIVFGPFTPESLVGLPASLAEISPGLDLATAAAHLARIRRAPESIVARVMAQFAQILDTMVAAGQKMFLTSQLHIEATLEANRELEQQNEKLEQMYARLKELDRLKSSFLATVSHELRTPLTSIIGYSEMLSEGLAGPLNEEQSEYLRTIGEKGDTLLKLITSMLDISQIEAGKVRLTFEPLDVAEVVQSAVTSVSPQAGKKGVALAARLPAPGELKANADRDKLRQVVVNLLANAVKFTAKGGRVALEVSGGQVQPELSAAGYRISVHDTGVGIPKDQLEKIFDSFYQVDNSSTREFGGAGLGLAIVKSYVEGHGGRVNVSSELGRGSSFVAVMPLVPPPRSMLVAPPMLPKEPDRF